jgi:hypothetical protein
VVPLDRDDESVQSTERRDAADRRRGVVKEECASAPRMIACALEARTALALRCSHAAHAARVTLSSRSERRFRMIP